MTSPQEKLDWVLDTLLIERMGFPYDASIHGDYPNWFVSEIARRWWERDGDKDEGPQDWEWSVRFELGMEEIR